MGGVKLLSSGSIIFISGAERGEAKETYKEKASKSGYEVAEKAGNEMASES